MKKRLTRIITLILSILMLFSIGLTTSGCTTRESERQREYLIKTMDSIPVEVEGYKLYRAGDETINDEEAVNFERREGVFNLQGKEVEVVVENYAWHLKYDEKDVELNEQFIVDRSSVYNKISTMWSEYESPHRKKMTIINKPNITKISIYNGYLFILMCRISADIIGDIRGIFPPSLFRYDILEDKIDYLGYTYIDDGYTGANYVFIATEWI